MDPKTMQRMRDHITESEKTRPNPYKDTKGKLTVGTGFLVDDEKSFVDMPFEILDTKTGEMRPATEAEKKAEFKRARGLSEEQLRDKATKSQLSLPDSENRRRLDAEITTRVDKVKKEIGEGDWNRLTDGQKTAVVDIHYANGSLEKFPSLKKAIKNGDAKAMAEQSDFHGGKMKDGEYLHRNFDRIRRNRAEMQGIEPESPEAYRAVADKYRGHPSLKDNYKKHGTPPGTSTQPAKPSGQPQASTSGDGYTIQAGDSLSKIAARHGISQEELAKANGITDPNRIRAGQTLKLPGQPDGHPEAGPSQPPVPQPPEAPAPGPASAPEPAPQPQEREVTPLPAPKPPAAPEPPTDPRAAALLEMAGKPVDNPGRAALLKPVETLTESEMKDMIASAQGDYRGWRSGDPLKAHTYERVQDWHTAIYGDRPQANDGGKPVEPTPVRPIPEQPSPHATPQGEDLWQATARIGQKVVDSGAVDGFDDAVKGLQRGLNILGEANPLPGRSPAYTKLGPVTEDGKYGPQTDFALKHATARHGPAKVDEAIALGRFNTFARNAQKSGNADGLADRTHSIFGPLFRKDDSGPKVEGGVLQETLNEFGPKRHDDWQPLKVDDWIGPKTTEAFGRVLKDEDSDSFTSAFGRGLGLL